MKDKEMKLREMLFGLSGGLVVILVILLIFHPVLEIMGVILVTGIFSSLGTIFGVAMSK